MEITLWSSNYCWTRFIHIHVEVVFSIKFVIFYHYIGLPEGMSMFDDEWITKRLIVLNLSKSMKSEMKCIDLENISTHVIIQWRGSTETLHENCGFSESRRSMDIENMVIKYSVLWTFNHQRFVLPYFKMI